MNKRIKDRALLDEFHKTKCLCCNRLSDPAHIKTRGSGGNDTKENVMPLCREHHTEQGTIGIATFAKKYPFVLFHLEEKGWEIFHHPDGQQKLRRK